MLHEYITVSISVVSCGPNQRANVISCVTVHDSDSSTASPLTPRPRHALLRGASTRGSKSLAVVAPSVKTQQGDGSTSKGASVTGQSHTLVYRTASYYSIC